MGEMLVTRDSKGANERGLLVVGYGAAGRAYAAGFAEAETNVAAVDPVANEEARLHADENGIALSKELPDDLSHLSHLSLIIILSPAAASLDIVRQIASRSGTCPVLDLTSSAPNAMRQAETLLPGRFADGTVLGAVGLGGLATPMVVSGQQASSVAAMLQPLGCRITCIAGPAGDASSLKLLRSLFMKGLEALVVETHLAAAALGQTDNLGVALADLSEIDMPRFLAEMLRTHPKHAARRTHEIEAAAELMQGAGLSSLMLPATAQLFRRTVSAGPGPDTSPEVALDWLDRHLNPQLERMHERG